MTRGINSLFQPGGHEVVEPAGQDANDQVIPKHGQDQEKSFHCSSSENAVMEMVPKPLISSPRGVFPLQVERTVTGESVVKGTPTAVPAERCDCLNFCGDDDRVVKGLAEPCDARKEEAERKRKAAAKEQAEKDEVAALRALEVQVRCYAWNPRESSPKWVLDDFNELLGKIDAARDVVRICS